MAPDDFGGVHGILLSVFLHPAKLTVSEVQHLYALWCCTALSTQSSGLKIKTLVGNGRHVLTKHRGALLGIHQTHNHNGTHKLAPKLAL